MKNVRSFTGRDQISNVQLSSNGFDYEIQHAWAKWPQEIIGSHILGAAFDKKNHLFVTTNCLKHPICEFDTDGNYLRSFGEGLFIRPHGLCFTNRETILVPDTSAELHTVREISFKGNLIRNYGEHPFEASNTGYDPQAFINAKICGRIPADKPFDKITDLSMRLDSIERTAEPFNRPCSVAVASTGEMFIADGYGNAALHKFDMDGNYLETWGRPGSDIGEFRLPHWVFADKYDRIWLCDRENSRAYAYSTDGTILIVVQGGFMRIASCFADRDNLYFGELGGGLSIVNIDSIEIVAQFGYPEFQPLVCHGICGDSFGNLVVTSIFGSPKTGNLFRLRRMR